MSRHTLGWAGISGALAVLLGAFGAHALRHWLPLQRVTIFETGVHYHLVHTLALLGTGLARQQVPARERGLRIVAWLFGIGIVLFSGSLYGWALTDWVWLTALTPVGGLAWVAAWGGLAWLCLRAPRPA